jgi:DNA-binding NtrC family response regulator
MSAIDPLSEVRKRYIQQVLALAQGDLDQASRILGVSAQDLRKLLLSHGLAERPEAASVPTTPEE